MLWTTTTTSSLTPEDVVRDAVNRQMMLGGTADVVDILHRLLARQRRLQRFHHLLGVAIEEVLPWLHAPNHAQALNSPSMEAQIWEAISGEAGQPSGSGFVEANTEVHNLLVLLRPGLPTTLEEL